MTEQESWLPQEEQPEVVESFLPAPDVGPVSRVPRNVAEIAAQIALAVDDDDRPFNVRYGEKVSDINAGGADAALGQVLERELDDQVVAARAQTIVFAKNQEADRLLFASKLTAQAEQAKAELSLTTAPVQAQQAVASRALEMLGIEYAQRVYRDMGVYAADLDSAAGDIAARNILALESSQVDDQASIWNRITQFGRSMIPFMDDVIVARAISKVIGKDFTLDKYAALTEFRNFMLGIPTKQERQEVVKRLMAELSSNPAVKADSLRQIAELTKDEASFDIAANALGAVDIASLFHGLGRVARKGLPLKNVKDVAGDTKAGELAAADLMSKAGLTGLNDAELVSRVIAGGVSPFEADPAALKGINAAAQAQLKQGWDTMLASLQERLNSAAMTPEEVADAASKIRASFMPSSNKQVYHVEFGEASADGQKMVVYWQNPKGKPFTSEKAAEEWVADRGLAPGTYRIVPKNTLDTPSSRNQSSVFDDWANSEGTMFTPEEARDILRAMRGRSAQEIDEFFGVEASLNQGDMFRERMLADFHDAVRKGNTNINARKVLDTIISTVPDEDIRLIAQTLLSRKGVDWERVPVGLNSELRATGMYYPTVDRVMLSIVGGIDPETVVHELVHAHNAQVIDIALKTPTLAARTLTKEQVAAANDLSDLWRRTRRHADKHEMKLRAKEGSLFDPVVMKKIGFANENPAELLAWGITNPNVRSWLQGVKLKDLGYTNNEQSVFSKLWELFKDVLGFRSDATAEAKLISIYERFLNSTTDDTRAPLIRLQRQGKITPEEADAIVGAEFDKKRVRSKSEWLVQQTRNDPLSYNSIGQFSDKDIQSMPWIAIDPKHGASELGIEARVVGVHAEAKTRKELTDFITPYYRGLGKDGVARVRGLLEEGDSFSNGGSYGREFTYAEALGKGLSDKEAEAYLATRQLRMTLYHIRNGEMVRHMRAQGLKEIEFLGTSIKTAGQVLDSGDSYVGQWLYDAARKEMVKLDATEMATAYGGGKRIVRLAKPAEVHGELRSVMLVDDKVAKSREIVTALHYRPGEYSRIYSDEYFITATRNTKVDGVVKPMTETIRTARSAREAQEFVARVTNAVTLMRAGKHTDDVVERLIGDYFGLDEFKKAYAAGDFDDITKLDFHFSRNKDEYLNGSVSEALANGRLFTSIRSERLLSTDAGRANTLGVYESLEAEITSVSRVANIGQWRESMVRRWMNTFGDLLPQRTGNDVADFFAAAGGKFTKNDKNSVFAERTHKYIMRQIGLRTAEERYYQEMTRRMSEHFLTGNETIETAGQWVRKQGILGMIRNINFNLTLGMFNPAQLIVQANGAATAMILSPLHGLAAAKTFPLLRMALMSDNPSVHSFFAKAQALSDLGLSSADEFVSLVKAIRQTGIIDNLKSTALWNMEDGKLNIFGGMPSRVIGSNTFFFNRGEEFSRIVSFDVARREWIKAHPEGNWTSKEALAQIVVRMDDLTQNMTKANLARFQEGLASIPLQFAQYNIKLATNIMTSLLGKGEGRGFTKTEAVKLLAGHILLYGAAGTGLSSLIDEIVPKNVKDSMSVEQKTYLAQGLLAGVTAQAGEALFGERTNVAVGSRLGVFNYYQQLAEAAYKDPKNIYEVLMGPSLSTAKRAGVVGEVFALWRKDPDLSAQDLLSGMARITTEQASSLRNAAKAYLFHQHQNKMIDSKGFAVAQLTTPEVIAQALGFQPGVAVDVHNLIKSKRDHTEALKDIAELAFKIQKDIMTARHRGDHAYADEQHKLLTAIWPANAGDLMEVQRYIRDRLYPYDTDFQRLLGEYVWKGHTYDKPLVVTEQPRKER